MEAVEGQLEDSESQDYNMLGVTVAAFKMTHLLLVWGNFTKKEP